MEATNSATNVLSFLNSSGVTPNELSMRIAKSNPLVGGSVVGAVVSNGMVVTPVKEKIIQ